MDKQVSQPPHAKTPALFNLVLYLTLSKIHDHIKCQLKAQHSQAADNEKIQIVRKDCEERIIQLNQEYQSKLDALKEKSQKDMQSFKDSCRCEKLRCEKQSSKRESMLKVDIQILQTAHQRQIFQLGKQKQQQLNELNRSHKEEMKQLLLDLSEKDLKQRGLALKLKQYEEQINELKKIEEQAKGSWWKLWVSMLAMMGLGWLIGLYSMSI